MATWRRRAIELFPDRKDDLNTPDYSVYLLFFDLLPAVGEALRDNDDKRLAAIFTFGEWCARQSLEGQNAAAVAFYEHLFDEPSIWEGVAAWLPADIRAQHVGLWEWKLPPQEFARVKKLLAAVPPRDR